MTQRYDCSDETERGIGVINATKAVQAGELVVLPTDTVYGVGADAFDADAVAGLVAAKGRGRTKPPPVLVGNLNVLDAVAFEISDVGRQLVDAFWPGALTLICREQPSLAWDLGDTGGTVAVRMPDNDLALELLAETGPMAVTSANLTGLPPATTVDEAYVALSDKVAVYLDGGETPGSVPSTIVDLTSPAPRILRAGAISAARLRAVVPEIENGT